MPSFYDYIFILFQYGFDHFYLILFKPVIIC